MKYAIFCYSSERVVSGLSREADDAMLRTLAETQVQLDAEGRLGAVARLLPTTSAVTVRHGAGEPLVLDGPFAETKEQLLGFYLVECESLEAAVDAAKRLTHGRTPGSLEIRPLRSFRDYGAVQ
ncbi:MAG TPA: YciI family protein [Myxococcota bacterium]|jgi:hypothetical protein